VLLLQRVKKIQDEPFTKKKKTCKYYNTAVYKRQFLFCIENMRKNMVYYVYALFNCFRVCFSLCRDLQKEKTHQNTLKAF
jgi:hypothetical protein